MARKAKTAKGKPARKPPAGRTARRTAKARKHVSKPKPKATKPKATRSRGPAKRSSNSQPRGRGGKAKAASKPRGLAPATTSGILAGVLSVSKASPASVPRKWASHYRSLCQVRNALLEQSGRLVKEVQQEAIGFSMHMADSGTDSFDRDFALTLLSADQNALMEVEAAIRRIQSGQYGVCEMTGQPIGKVRLEAIPWTRFSYEAQQQLEKTGQASRVHLGTPRTVLGSDTVEPEESDEGDEKPEKG